jgi:hypothetical protein
VNQATAVSSKHNLHTVLSAPPSRLAKCSYTNCSYAAHDCARCMLTKFHTTLIVPLVVNTTLCVLNQDSITVSLCQHTPVPVP